MAKITTRAIDAASSINFANPQQTTAGIVEFWWNIIQCLLSAGWTHWASGTGTGGTFSTTPGNVNNQITSTGTGAGGFDRNNAWIILRCPASKRQILIQRGTASTAWRVYYSALDTFNGTGFGAVSATVPPSATDQQQLIGAAAAFVTFATPSASLYTRFHCVAYSDAVNTDVYSFYAWATSPSSPTISFVFCLEALRQYNASDADPLVFVVQTGSIGSSTNAWGGTGSLNWFGWYKMNLAGEAFVAWRALGWGVNTSQAYVPAQATSGVSTGVGPDPNDQAEPSVEPIIARANTDFGSSQSVKGTLLRMRWSGTVYRTWPARHDPSSTAEARINIDGMWAPWLANTIGSSA
jgi:hypothetical protein